MPMIKIECPIKTFKHNEATYKGENTRNES